jgi:hypothetical protein
MKNPYGEVELNLKEGSGNCFFFSSRFETSVKDRDFLYCILEVPGVSFPRRSVVLTEICVWTSAVPTRHTLKQFLQSEHD